MMLTACPDELPNPYKNCIREMLNTLVCNDHDIKRINAELRNIQKDLKAELEKMGEVCGPEKRRLVCESFEDLSKFAKRVANADEVKHHYTKMSDDLRKRRDSIMVYAKQCLAAYQEEKCKFKSFHENTVEYIKRTACLSQDQQVITRCERDICGMHKRFVKEVANIKRCETELMPFFKLLKESDPNVICECCCFKGYDWMPGGKSLAVVDTMADEIKEQMGKVLARAFAQLHVHMPQDPRSFLAAYLMNIERNEAEVEKKLNILQNQGPPEKEISDPIFECDVKCKEQPAETDYVCSRPK